MTPGIRVMGHTKGYAAFFILPILDRFLHHAEIIAITGKSYRLKNQAGKTRTK
ncbi:MAG: ATP-binding protein [Candidatus Krumholzibacteriia bacterium]